MGKRKPLRANKGLSDDNQKDEDEQHKLKKPKSSSKVDKVSSDAGNERIKSNNKNKSSASSGKKEDHDDGNEDDDDEDSNNDDDEDDDIKIDGSSEHVTEEYTFEFNDMRDDYSEGLTTLLKKDLIQNPTSAYHVATLITSQTIVGTAITCEGANDTFAFATVLPLPNIQSNEAGAALWAIVGNLKSVLEAFQQKAKGDDSASIILEHIAGSKVCATGLLLHKRFSNLPLQLVSALHVNLEEDLGWAKHNHESDDKEGNDFVSMNQILILAACSSDDFKGKKKDKKSGGSSDAVNVLGRTDLLFEYFEDEIYLQNASSAFLFQPKGVSTPLVAALIPLTSLKKCIKEITKMVPAADH